MKYFLHLAYKGTNYHGWQRQEQVSSVQATIEDDLRKMFQRDDLTIHGCGRTDAGVHASHYYAHFVVDKEIEFDLVYKLNRMLPDDIVIYDLIPVVEKANAQLDAISRTYEYHIHLKKDPFLIEKSACYDMLDLDLELMNAATQLLTKYEDFKYFCLQPELHKHTRCLLKSVEMTVNPAQDRIFFTFTS
ncbi:MAG: tRNA pseudouridine38-40 synthase, partial [Saprospiraceae bacterium]